MDFVDFIFVLICLVKIAFVVFGGSSNISNFGSLRFSTLFSFIKFCNCFNVIPM